MRVMVIMKATRATESGRMPTAGEIDAMIRFHEEAVNAGILVAADGLLPSSQGARIEFSGAEPRVIDGPFTETKELVAGYWILQVKSMAEAVEWAKRIPNANGSIETLEIRRFAEAEDCGDMITPEMQERVRRMEEQGALNANA